MASQELVFKGRKVATTYQPLAEQLQLAKPETWGPAKYSYRSILDVPCLDCPKLYEATRLDGNEITQCVPRHCARLTKMGENTLTRQPMEANKQ